MVEDFVRARGHLTLGSRLKRIGERLQADVTRLSERLGLPIPSGHYPLLAALASAGPTSIGVLARRLGVRQPAVTRSVLQLEAAGLVATSTDLADRRVRIVALTDRGAEMVRRAERLLWPAVEEAVRRLCDDLDGPLLTQLDGFEDALALAPLDRRAEALVPRDPS
jgi:DNA-binding MarR family transcriptional regulator